MNGRFPSHPNYDEAYGPFDLRHGSCPALSTVTGYYSHGSFRLTPNSNFPTRGRFVSIDEVSEEMLSAEYHEETQEERDNRVFGDHPEDPPHPKEKETALIARFAERPTPASSRKKSRPFFHKNGTPESKTYVAPEVSQEHGPQRFFYLSRVSVLVKRHRHHERPASA